MLTEVQPAHPPVTSSAAGLVLERIQDVGRLHELRPQWAALAAASHGCSIFQRPEWLLPFVQHLGQFRPWGPAVLRALAVWRGPQLCGLAVLELGPADGPQGHVLRFVGGPVSDRHGLLVARDADREGQPVSRMLVGGMLGEPAWDRCELSELADDDPLPQHLQAWLFPGCRLEVGEGEVCPFVALQPPDSGRSPPRSDSFEGRLGRALRALASQGPVSMERARPHEVGPFMDALFRLHATRWSTRGEAGVLALPAVERFHRDVAQQMAEVGRLRLWGLRVGVALRAIFYGFSDGRTLSAYLGGFHPALARYSPGLLTIWQAMRAGAAEGLSELDFLRGGEAYKFRFGARRRHNRTLIIHRP